MGYQSLSWKLSSQPHFDNDDEEDGGDYDDDDADNDYFDDDPAKYGADDLEGIAIFSILVRGTSFQLFWTKRLSIFCVHFLQSEFSNVCTMYQYIQYKSHLLVKSVTSSTWIGPVILPALVTK